MAEVPYRASPQVEPAATAPPVYYEPRIHWPAIGAAARGLEQFGEAVAGVGNFWGEVQTDRQLNQALKEGDQAVEQFKTLKGQDALDAQDGLRQHLSEIGDRYRSQLSPVQQHRFDQAWRPYEDRYWNGQITTHAVDEGNKYTTDTNKGMTELALSQVAADPYNEQIAAAAKERNREAAVKQGQFMGERGTALQFRIDNADMWFHKTRAEAMFARGDSLGAIDYIDKNQKELGAAYTPLSKEFRAKVDAEKNGLLTDTIREQAEKGGDFSAPPALLTQPPRVPESSNVVPLRPAPPAPAAAPKAPGTPDALGRTGGQGVTIDVPFGEAMKYGTPDAMINQALKTYKPGTTLKSFGNTYTIPPAGTKFQFSGKEYTVPSEPAASATAPTAEKMNYTPESIPSPASSLGPSYNLGPAYEGKISDGVTPQAGGVNRSAFMREIDQKPWLVPKMASMVYGEVGKGAPVKTQLVQLETAFNRAQVRGISLEQALLSVGESNRGYYARDTYHRIGQEDVNAFVNDVLKPVLSGSDLGGGATGNASGGVAANQAARGTRGFYLPAAGGQYESYFFEGPFTNQLPRNPATQAAAPPLVQVARGEE